MKQSFDKESGEVIFQGYGKMPPCIATTLWQAGIEPDSVKKLLVKDGITIVLKIWYYKISGKSYRKVDCQKR